jgi:SAM-dependent methyltransferase
MMLVKSCMLCGSDKLSIILKASDYRIVECKECKIAFTDPAPSLPDYEAMDFHSKDDIANVEHLTSVEDLPYDWKRLINQQLEIISTHFFKDAAILEIGCGEGILLDTLQKNGFTNIEGVEPSKTAALRAKKKGLTINNTYFDSSTATKKYDLVMMAHVFEHIENPYKLLEQVQQVLNESGYIMLTQTNYKGLLPRLQKRNWYAWVPDQHYWHFTPESLNIMFKKLDFTVSELNYCSLVHPHTKLYKLAKLIPSWRDQFILLAKRKLLN